MKKKVEPIQNIMDHLDQLTSAELELLLIVVVKRLRKASMREAFKTIEIARQIDKLQEKR